MEDWQYTFPPVSKNEWLQRIEQDLKGRSPEELQKEWWPGHMVDPFHHAGDQTPPVALPDDYFSGPPLLMDWFSFPAGEIQEVNKRILSALQNGTQTIVLDPTDHPLPDFDQLLNNVHTEMVEVQLNVRHVDLIDILIGETITVPLVIRMNRNDQAPNEFFTNIRNLQQQNFHVRIVYPVPHDADWINSSRLMFEQIHADVMHYNSHIGSVSDFSQSIILNIESVTGFYQHILRSRVIQLCWLNLMANLRSEAKKTLLSPLECHIQNTDPEDPDKNLIRASSAFLASALSGTKSVCIHSLELQGLPEFYGRINSNIHHILNYESQIYRGSDPLKGSYFFDFYSKKWTEEILAGLLQQE